MNLPSFNGEYKDKPISRPWKLRNPQFRIRRIIASTAILAIVLWFFSSTISSFTGLHKGISSRVIGIYDDDGLYIDKKATPSSLVTSIAKAMKEVQARPIRNIFFVLNGLTGTDTSLVSLGCDMANAKLGATVNFIILGGGAMTIELYRSMNQFEHEACPAYFHEARAIDPTLYNSYAANTIRMLASDHSPSAFIFTHSLEFPKPHWFLAALARHERETTQITLSRSSLDSLAWMAYLTPLALNAWNKPRIDLVIDVSSRPGSLNRLFRSLEAAHYPNDQYPNLIINLDTAASAVTLEIIARLSQKWPTNRLIIHRRAREVDLAFLENWYPANNDNFALFLSDQYELSPYYFHYLKAMLLQYQYDLPGRLGLWRENQFGITLQSLLAKETQVPESMKNFKNIKGSIRKTQIPVLWNHADLSGPTLFYPNHFASFTEFAREKGHQNVQELLDSFVLEKKLLMMYPPNFSMDDGDFVLSQYYADDTVEDPMTYKPNELGHQLLNDKNWWKCLGKDMIMPSWSLLEVYNAQNENQAMVSFFRDQATGSTR